MKKALLLSVVLTLIILSMEKPVQSILAADSAWTGQYYKNRSLQGVPALERQDRVITFNWGYSGPADGWPTDNFSIRWTRKDYFNNGVYVFAVRSDDGIKIFVDGVKVLDAWYQHEGADWFVTEKQMTAGEHTTVIEYFEQTGYAQIQAGYFAKNPVTATRAATGTSVATPTSGPSPTPTIPPPPAATRTPSIRGTLGVQPTALLVPPAQVVSSGNTAVGGSTTTVIIDQAAVKKFAWFGFPGPANHSGGQNGSYGYVKNRNTKPTLKAQWYVALPAGGYYDVYVYLPADVLASKQVTYRVMHNGQLSPPVVINQASQSDSWVIVGSFYFSDSPSGQYIYLDNQTGEETATHNVLLDAIMLVFKP
jgi:hypothetical protein